MSTINDPIIARIEEKFGAVIPKELKNKIARKLEEMRSYTPKVGIFGKTGVGKSSLCNALLGSDVCPISDFEACTRAPQKVLLELGGAGIQLVDLLGVGESGQRGKEYDALYQSLLPELDLILFVLNCDGRYAIDEDFYKEIIRRYMEAGKPFIAVINQVDKIEPFREWDCDERKPSPKQLSNIEKKRQDIAGLLGIPMSKVIAVSANERYGLVELIASIVCDLDGVTEVWLRVAPEVAHYFSRRALLPQQQQYPNADGSLLVSTKIDHVSQLLPVVRYWLPHVRVVQPVEWHEVLVQGLRQDLAQWEI